VKNFPANAWRFIKRAVLFLFLFQFIYIIILKWIDPPVTLTQLGSLLSGHGLKRDYVNYTDISKFAKLAVMASEDQLFPDHEGFDFKSIKKAMAYNEKKPGRIPWWFNYQSAGSEECFFMAGPELDTKGIRSIFYFYDRIDLGQTKNP
jgi:monofunctional biosynthetic peptidoglycan transglycosylase